MPVKIKPEQCKASVFGSSGPTLYFPTKELYEQYLREELEFKTNWEKRLRELVEYPKSYR